MSNNSLTQAWHYVEHWAENLPEKESLVFNEERLSWADFKKNMDMVAKAFLDAGVEQGDRIAMLAMARTEFMTTYMAAGKIGAMWLGLNPKFTLDELRYQLNDSRPRVLITVRTFMENDLADNIRTLMQEMPFIEKVLVLGDPFDGAESYYEYVWQNRDSLDSALLKRSGQVKESDNALLMYTSGSTGKPKGVVQTHSSITSNINVMTEKLHYTPDDRMIVHFPINHVASDVEIGLSCIYAGGTLIFMEKFDPVESLMKIQEEKITILGQVPVMYLMQMQAPLWRESDWYKTIRAYVISGAIPPAPLIEALKKIREETGCLVYNAYGSTEACGLVTYTDDDDSLDFIARSIGTVPAPMQVRIVDDDGNDVSQGEVGEMILKGPFLFKEYYNMPEKTGESFENGWFHTNDLAFADEHGNLFMTGRKSEMFKTGGENVFPREIEEVLEGHESVLFAAVISVPDEIYQEVGWGYIMLKPGQSAGEDELRELCRAKLANFKVPKKFIIRPELPLLATGKINKVALKEEVKKQLSN